MKFTIQPMHIGQVIREIREARKATLEEVALAADTNASNLSRIERGAQGYSPETLERIAIALGVTMSGFTSAHRSFRQCGRDGWWLCCR